MNKKWFLYELLFVVTFTTNANIIKVPDEQSTIQTAINGDTILVSPGTYFENINFRGKRIVLTSYYIFKKDTGYIRTTVINGSKPTYPDTASCIIFASGEDYTTVVQGFTITGGKGTKWPDIEYNNTLFREGGGILIDFSSPTITHNYIINNIVDDRTGVNSYGGGAIRIHKGNPQIMNNLITENSGNYGGAIVLYYSGGIFKNNIVFGNTAGTDYGGSPIWISQSFSKPCRFENNTIAGNISGKEGGGLRVNGTSVQLKSNIIWGNVQSINGQLAGIKMSDATFNVIQGGISEGNNINDYPVFLDTNLYLSPISPCIDKGDTSVNSFDPENLNVPGTAKFPSLGALKNDIGVYGGPNADIFLFFEFSRICVTSTLVSLGNNNTVGVPLKKSIIIINQSTDNRAVDSVIIMEHKNHLKIKYYPVDFLLPLQSDSIQLEWTPADNQQFSDTVLLYHNTLKAVNPIKIAINGKAVNPTDVRQLQSEKSIQNYPDPFADYTTIRYNIPDHSASLVVYDTSGRIIKKYDKLKGTGSVQFDGKNLPNGEYLYKLIAENKNGISLKMIVLH